MLGFTEKPLVEIRSDKIDLQHLKALKRAPQGTMAFRFYLPTDNRVVLHNQVFDGFAGIIVNHLIKPHIIEEAVYA